MNVRYAIKNQNKIFNILNLSKKQDRLSHAYLFYGSSGTGKKEMAYALACLIYCEYGGCLECDTCKSILNGNHMNVDYIGIIDDKKMISKDQISELQEEFSKTSLIDGTRIYIVDGIDTASSAAQNSLLKFIEEPINQTPTIGIFLASELSNVVSTIQSRCFLQHFDEIPVNKMIEEMLSLGYNELDSALVTSLTNNIDEAKCLVLSDDFKIIKDLFLELIDLKKSKENILFYLKNVSYFSDVKKLKILLQWIILFLEDANKYNGSNDNLILKPIYDKIIIYIEKNEKDLQNKLNMVLGLYDKLKYNVSAKNVLHELIVNFN
ncbi:MAG: hypothetical protein ACI35S_02220 [Anaeroplasma sp.]